MLSFPLPEEEKEYLLSFSDIFHSREEAEQYLYDSWERMQVVLEWMQRLNEKGVRRVLELGSNPYYLTLLLRKHFSFELELANYFGASQSGNRDTHLVGGTGGRQEFEYSHFNLEVDPFPFEDKSFQCVLFCEIVEHLVRKPDFAMSEMNRILSPEGFLILTTPNALRLANLVSLIKGKNIYADYSPHGIYGRHNREYSLQEIEDLLRRNAFEIVEVRVQNIYPHPWRSRILQSLRPKTWYEHLFVLAQKR